MIVLSALVNITLPINLFIFMEVAMAFAQMDLLGGGNIIANNLVFFPTEPVNGAFNFFGIGDKNMMNNSGSFFFALGGIIGYMILKAFLNWLATKCASYHLARLMGIWSYQERFLYNSAQNSIKLFIESYFDLVFAVGVNLLAFIIFSEDDRLQLLFSTPWDTINSILTIVI